MEITGISRALAAFLLSVLGTPAASAPSSDQTGVFLRCTGQEDPRKALGIVKSLGLHRVQISRLPARYYTADGAKEVSGMLKETGISVDAVVVVFDGESYRDQETVKRTVGFRPLDLQAERLEYAKRCVDFADAIGTKIVTLHMGFLPKDKNDSIYKGMFAAVRTLATYAQNKGITISLETGQETGEELAQFLDSITSVRVGVNFDFANLILYGLDSSPRALRRLLDRVTSVHVKDGLPPSDPRLLGREVRLGEGQAEVRECLRLLRDSGFKGPFIIENYVSRNLGTDPVSELRRSMDFIRESLSN